MYANIGYTCTETYWILELFNVQKFQPPTKLFLIGPYYKNWYMTIGCIRKYKLYSNDLNQVISVMHFNVYNGQNSIYYCRISILYHNWKYKFINRGSTERQLFAKEDKTIYYYKRSCVYVRNRRYSTYKSPYKINLL